MSLPTNSESNSVNAINILIDEPQHFKAEKTIDFSGAIIGSIFVLFMFGYPFILSLVKSTPESSVSPLIFILILPIALFLFYYNIQHQRHSVIEVKNDIISTFEKTFFGKIVNNVQTTLDINMMTEVKKIVHEKIRERYTNEEKDVITYVVRYRTINPKDQNYKSCDIISGLSEEEANFLSNKINEMILRKRQQVS